MKLHSAFRPLALAATLALGLAGAAQAQNYSFSCVSQTSVANCTTGESQLGLTFTAGLGFVEFLFTNAGPLASSITDIYWDWMDDVQRLSEEGAVITASNGVTYNWGASPGNLPSGASLTPDFSAELAADSDAPAQHNGVNPTETVSFRFLTGLNDTTGADLFSGLLRVGVHVQGFGDGGSESFVTGGTTPIASPAPEPESYAMMLAGLGIVGAFARRKKRQA